MRDTGQGFAARNLARNLPLDAFKPANQGRLKVQKMFKFLKSRPWPPALDTAGLRETLGYMQNDLERVPELEKAAEALGLAIDELKKAEIASGNVPAYEPLDRQVRTFSRPLSPGGRR